MKKICFLIITIFILTINCAWEATRFSSDKIVPNSFIKHQLRTNSRQVKLLTECSEKCNIFALSSINAERFEKNENFTAVLTRRDIFSVQLQFGISDWRQNHFIYVQNGNRLLDVKTTNVVETFVPDAPRQNNIFPIIFGKLFFKYYSFIIRRFCSIMCFFICNIHHLS